MASCGSCDMHSHLGEQLTNDGLYEMGLSPTIHGVFRECHVELSLSSKPCWAFGLVSSKQASTIMMLRRHQTDSYYQNPSGGATPLKIRCIMIMAENMVVPNRKERTMPNHQEPAFHHFCWSKPLTDNAIFVGFGSSIFSVKPTWSTPNE